MFCAVAGTGSISSKGNCLNMRVTFLGTGDAGGVPVYGCECEACELARTDESFRRRPCSALVETGNTRILIDAGLTDLAERFPPGSLSAILLTHFHPDHVQGLFHLRWGIADRIPVYAPPDSEGCADLYKNPGLLDFLQLSKFDAFTIGELTLTPLPLIHSKVTFGYAIEDPEGHRFAYLTDTVGLPPKTESFLKEWMPESVALDCTHPPKSETPRNHNDLTIALTIAEKLTPANIWLTHISHDMDNWLSNTALNQTKSIQIARDYMTIELPMPEPPKQAV
jgi:phosphoribosyl 1,2-cyclic phosphate phosphodiesterase